MLQLPVACMSPSCNLDLCSELSELRTLRTTKNVRDCLQTSDHVNMSDNV